MRNYFLVFIALLSFTTQSQIDEVRRITEVLCSEEFHGRGYVNSGDSIASAFIASEFEALGVQPYGDTYFQDFSFPVNSFPGKMDVSLEGKSIIPGKEFVVGPASPSYKGVLHPYRIDAKLASDEDRLIARIRMIMKGDEYNSVLLDFIGTSEDTLKNLRGLANSITPVLPVIELIDSKFTWSVALHQQENILIQLNDSAYVHGADLTVDVEAVQKANHAARNVIAYIPAQKKCSKTVVFSAHYDHLGRMGENTYFPGANDNASGTAMLITMAKYFKDNPSDYNVMFIAFAGEEAGLLGSKYYVENPLFKLKKIRFLVNLDIMGSGEEGITAVNGTLFEKEFGLLQSINEENDLLEKVKVRGPAANSDHYWFTEKGVPAFFIYTMGPNKHYHDIFDKYEELSFKEYEDITTLLIKFVSNL